MKKKLYILLVMIIVIPLAGELKIYPFHNTYRVSFGTPIFFFFLLWIKKMHPLFSGFIIGASVVIFRIFLYVFMTGNFQLYNSFMLNFPAFFYYLTYAGLFYIIGRKYLNHYLLLGFLSALIEISSSLVEISIRHIFLSDYINMSVFNEVIIIAIIRSFFVLGFFYIIKLHEKDFEVERQQEQNRNMAILISSLYEESIQLKKSLLNAEHITRNCYNLYRELKNSNEAIDSNALSKQILGIAGEVHEIKKDNQRIYAGLSKMILNGNSTDYMTLKEIIAILANTNSKYAEAMCKNIDFILDIEELSDLFHAFILLSILNNLVSNSVEAINKKGSIKISAKKEAGFLQFKLSDNGPGIPNKKLELIFKPGYTTKYDNAGKPSTGIGLSYVREIINSLNGSLNLQSTEKETIFTIKLPLANLTREE
ncbi:sensor histidine kinase [Clostridium neuense]|uniref:histidine kinase n=1 Tax=Clostridium neuense TaxID=1728934 RepID=A0ABW8TL62_9CLOT